MPKDKSQAKPLPDRFYATKDSIIILGTPDGDRKHEEHKKRLAEIMEWYKKKNK